jgi:hypothetical protein
MCELVVIMVQNEGANTCMLQTKENEGTDRPDGGPSGRIATLQNQKSVRPLLNPYKIRSQFVRYSIHTKSEVSSFVKSCEQNNTFVFDPPPPAPLSFSFPCLASIVSCPHTHTRLLIDLLSLAYIPHVRPLFADIFVHRSGRTVRPLFSIYFSCHGIPFLWFHSLFSIYFSCH